MVLLPVVGWVTVADASVPVGGRGSDDHNAAYCLSGPPWTVRVTYRDGAWGYGFRSFPIIISWGDHTITVVPTHRARHPYDYSHPFQADHTYAANFDPRGRFLTDNAFGPYTRLIVSLKRLAGTCPPPAQTPEVPFAIVLPISGLAIIGFVVWRRQRRAPNPLPS